MGIHKRSLWIDRRGADIYWPATGNVDISATGTGTIAYWVRTPAHNFWVDQKIWRIWGTQNNYMASYKARSVIVVSDGGSYKSSDVYASNEDGSWELHVTTWDFETGVVKSYYNDAQPVNDPLTGVPAPLGDPVGIYLGPIYDDALSQYIRDLFYYTLGIWDEEMSEEQISALYAQGYRHKFQQSEGPGNLTLLLSFHASLDADIAAGEGSWAQADGCSADRFCLLEDGIRQLGRARYPLGMPRHDLSEDDRKPLNAICPLLLNESDQRASTSEINETNYSRLIVDGHTTTTGAGAKFPDIPKPSTYRQLIHIPNDSDHTPPQGYELGIGPVAYKFYRGASTGVYDQLGSGRKFEVVDDAGNTATTFKTNLSGDAWSGDDYWNGALLTFYTDNCAGRSLYVTDYDDTTKFITLETALPAVPDAGSCGFVNFYPRIIGQDSSGVHPGQRQPEYAIEANLWAHHENSKHFVELEWQNPETTGLSILRYEQGRSVNMSGCSFYHGSQNRGAQYGKWYGDDGYYDQPGGSNLEIWLQKIEIDGPQQYQIVRKDATGRGPALADNFMVRAHDHFTLSGSTWKSVKGDSVKVWQQQNLTFNKQKPTKITDWQAVMGDLEKPGTWRETVAANSGIPVPIEYDEANETITAAIVGSDASGTRQLGYVVGHWDENTGRISWEDESPPAGKSNPILDVSTLRGGREQDADGTLSRINGILQSTDGTWSLIYIAAPDSMDGTRTYALHGAPDRWSFDPSTQHYGLFLPPDTGVDMRIPVAGHGIVPWANSDIYGPILHNPYAQDISRRFIALIRAKTIFNSGSGYSTDARPLLTYAGTDPKSLAPLPHGNRASPVVSPQVHNLCGAVLGQEDCIALLDEYTSGFTMGIGLFTSEDGIHFQELFPLSTDSSAFIPQGELAGEGSRLFPRWAFQLGDKRIYYYSWGSDFNFAWCRWNGETWYALSEDETEGSLQTAILEKPADGWGELYLNVEPNDGQASVEVLDPETELPIAGYGLEDCEAISAGLNRQVTWGAAGLSELTSDYLRLRLHFNRSQTTDTSPQLFAWEIKPAVVHYPSASDLRVEGQVNPTNVLDPTPTLSWTYHHPDDSPQSAYQIIVASSAELLAENTGDIWDSGVVLSSQNSVVYDGPALQDYETYFWKVRVRSAEGVWSEQW